MDAVKGGFLLLLLYVFCVSFEVKGWHLLLGMKEQAVNQSHLTDDDRMTKDSSQESESNNINVSKSAARPRSEPFKAILIGGNKKSESEIKETISRTAETSTLPNSVSRSENKLQIRKKFLVLMPRPSTDQLENDSDKEKTLKEDLGTMSPTRVENRTTVNRTYALIVIVKTNDDNDSNVTPNTLSWTELKNVRLNLSQTGFQSSGLKTFIEVPSLWVPPPRTSFKVVITGFLPIIIITLLFLASLGEYLYALYRYTRQNIGNRGCLLLPGI